MCVCVYLPFVCGLLLLLLLLLKQAISTSYHVPSDRYMRNLSDCLCTYVNQKVEMKNKFSEVKTVKRSR